MEWEGEGGEWAGMHAPPSLSSRSLDWALRLAVSAAFSMSTVLPPSSARLSDSKPMSFMADDDLPF